MQVSSWGLDEKSLTSIELSEIKDFRVEDSHIARIMPSVSFLEKIMYLTLHTGEQYIIRAFNKLEKVKEQEENMKMICKELGKYEEAISCSDKTLEVSSGDEDARSNRHTTLIKMKEDTIKSSYPIRRPNDISSSERIRLNKAQESMGLEAELIERLTKEEQKIRQRIRKLGVQIESHELFEPNKYHEDIKNANEEKSKKSYIS